NMLIGITSGISFARFFFYLMPVALLSTAALILVMYLFYRKAFERGFDSSSETSIEAQAHDAEAMKRLVPILILVMVAFFLSSFLKVGIPLIALGAAPLVLLLGRRKPSAIVKEVDWTLLLFFAGLFVIIGGAHKAGVLDVFMKGIVIAPDLSGIVSVALVSTAVSQLVSNVPLTMLVIPLLKNVPGDVLWIALAAGATLGGNLTIIGAVANIIVAEGAAREGVSLDFMEFLKVGAVVTAVTVALAVLVLGGEYWLGWLR
ncbi:MAG: ArsB/NhaD family transporter, partial [Chloroflexota bacterium]|nr:ArsB/NhaD family transporter [Chloroflexota bacterium]